MAMGGRGEERERAALRSGEGRGARVLEVDWNGVEWLWGRAYVHGIDARPYIRVHIMGIRRAYISCKRC